MTLKYAYTAVFRFMFVALLVIYVSVFLQFLKMQTCLAASKDKSCRSTLLGSFHVLYGRLVNIFSSNHI